MSELEKIQRYIDLTKISWQTSKRYGMSVAELNALLGIPPHNAYEALHMAFKYGMSKGIRSARAESKQKA